MIEAANLHRAEAQEDKCVVFKIDDVNGNTGGGLVLGDRAFAQDYAASVGG